MAVIYYIAGLCKGGKTKWRLRQDGKDCLLLV